jgi:hypothetical protein
MNKNATGAHLFHNPTLRLVEHNTQHLFFSFFRAILGRIVPSSSYRSNN